LVEVVPRPGYRLWLRFDDGTQGEADLSEDIGKGVLALLRDEAVFSKVRIGEQGQVTFTDNVDLCPDSLYLEISGKSAEEVLTTLKAQAVA
jgi:hypothetical protein